MIKIPVRCKEAAVKALMKNHAVHKGVKIKAAAAHAPLRVRGASAVQDRETNKRALTKSSKTFQSHHRPFWITIYPSAIMIDFLVIGSGAAGLAAALYAGRYRLKTVIVGESFGGYTSIAGVIENYPGNKNVDGFELMMIMKEQAEEVGATVVDGRIASLMREGELFTAKTEDGKTYQARTILLAMGMEHRQLGLPNEKELTSKGVHYCVTCDGPLYRDKVIAVVGGGDSAVKGASLAAEHTKKIYLIVRGTQLRAEPINYEELKALGDKVEILFETEVREIVGPQRFEKIILSKPYHGSTELILDGLFIEIGAVPRSDLAKQLAVELDANGFVKSDPFCRTNRDGVFVAGDLSGLFGSFKQDITSAAMGAVAATSVYDYCKKNPFSPNRT